MWSRKEIKARGKECFKRNYWKSVLVGIVYYLFFATSSGTVIPYIFLKMRQTEGYLSSTCLADDTAFF